MIKVEPRPPRNIVEVPDINFIKKFLTPKPSRDELRALEIFASEVPQN